ncbi:uncharacterized protein LOC116169862 isoform X2 [Photinus pyralis]|uniref:uncharacterized protein LOC116169862 isoform X2 n=1 Tax=Photinus pyralis TaxID=7054 RepID=UPI0012670421|nr:uncharacterized protein LOC116169862 isoform X2 [Photinus pyralis]
MLFKLWRSTTCTLTMNHVFLISLLITRFTMKNKKDTSFNLDDFTSTTTLATNEVSAQIPSNGTLKDDGEYNPFEHRIVEHPTSYLGDAARFQKCWTVIGFRRHHRHWNFMHPLHSFISKF